MSDRYIQRLEDELAALKQAQTWQPIAKHNGSPFLMLIAWEGTPHVRLGWFQHELGVWMCADASEMFEPQPTHFRLLPAPPDGPREEQP